MDQPKPFMNFVQTREIPINLDIKSEDGRQKVLTQMGQLRAHPGWQLLYQDLLSLINQTESDIFTVGSNEVLYSNRDLLILFHGFMNAVLNRPDYIISHLTQTQEKRIEEADPYVD